MLGIELTTAQKIQVGVVVVVLSLSGYFLYTGFRAQADMHMVYSSLPRTLGKDPSQPISAKNPKDVDPKHVAVARQFVFYDGTLTILQYPADTGLGVELSFKPDTRRKAYQVYRDPVKAIDGMSDAYKRALTETAYMAAEENPMGVLKSAGLDKDQLAAEKSARETMMNSLLALRDEARGGVVAVQLHKALQAALADFDKTPGEVLKSSKKAAAGRKVVVAALAYMDAVEGKRMELINQYVAALDRLLKDDQKPKVVTAAAAAQNRWKNAATQPAPIAAGLARS